MKGLDPGELVVDTCCGMGDDLMCLRTAFKRVVGIERNPVVYRMLADARQHFSLGGVEILLGDARDYDGPGKIFYMDPMYPPGPRKKSRAKGQVEWLKTLCGDDPDQGELLQALLAKRPERVVCKRPLRSRVLFPDKIRYTLKGKLVRFDIY